MNRMIETDNLAIGYNRKVLMDHISFSAMPGEILVLIGPNGAGKSTVLKTITRQLQALGGTIYLGKDPMQGLKDGEIAKRMSLVLTERPKGELMTVEDMVETGRYPYTGALGILGAEDRKAVEEALRMVRLLDVRDREYDRISDGQKQRVLLARAIAQEPQVLVLDEPTSYLDMHHKVELLAILKKLAREKKISVVMSLHELDLAQKCADHLLCIAEGKIDSYGTPEEIFGKENYISSLYEMDRGTFLPAYGSLELERVAGDSQVFVIGGGGSGIPVYRQLQRQGIPFAAGIIHKNDLEYPVAKALAAEVIDEDAFSVIGQASLEKAKEVMKNCSRVVCPLKQFGDMNRANEQLREQARSEGKLE